MTGEPMSLHRSLTYAAYNRDILAVSLCMKKMVLTSFSQSFIIAFEDTRHWLISAITHMLDIVIQITNFNKILK